jgi:hypothetical protein
MKTIKLTLKAPDGSSEEVLLSFDDTELEKLKLFSENFSRFTTARMLEKRIPSIRQIAWTESDGLKFTFSDFE